MDASAERGASAEPLVEVDTITRTLQQVFEALGVSADEAATTARICCEAEMLGRRTHGIRLFRNIQREHARGAARRRGLQVLMETPSSALVDGGFHLGPWCHDTAAQLAARKARAHGIGVVAVRNAGVSGALGVHTMAMARHGLVGIALNGSPSVVVSPGTATPTLGSNPLSIALPREGEHPLVLDMATSAISFNQVMMARASGDNLPDGVAVDADGVPTTDAAAMVAETGHGRLLPFGGHRGFGLSLMIELMVAAGVSGIVGQTKITDFIPEPDQFPGIYLAYRSDLFGSGTDFAGNVEQLLAELSDDNVRVPGLTSMTAYDEAARAGRVRISAEAAAILENSGNQP